MLFEHVSYNIRAGKINILFKKDLHSLLETVLITSCLTLIFFLKIMFKNIMLKKLLFPILPVLQSRLYIYDCMWEIHVRETYRFVKVMSHFLFLI